MMAKPLKLLLCVALMGAAGAAFGADDDLKTYEMDEMVVTGSKMPQTPGNVTQKIEIISAARIEEMVLGNGNLAEILSYSPGNYANALSRNDANWGSSGGLPSTYKGYMLDGLPIDVFADLQSLDPWAFERVEDQRGSASVLYPTYLVMDGPGNQSALAGTANFILKERVAETRTATGLAYGSYNTVNSRFFHQRAAGDLHLFFGGNYEDSDYTDYGTDDSWLKMTKDPEYEKTKLYMRATHFLPGAKGHRLGLYAHRTWHTGDTGRPNRDFAHTYTTLNASYLLPVSEGLILQAKAGHRDFDRTWEDDRFNPDTDSLAADIGALPAYLAATDLSFQAENGVEQTIMPADLSLSYQHSGDDLLTVGVDYQTSSYKTWLEPRDLVVIDATDATVYEQIALGDTAEALRLLLNREQLLQKLAGIPSRSVANDATATSFGVYAQEEQRLGKLIVRAGARYNHISHDIDLLQGAPPGDDTNSWNKLLWSAGVRYNQSEDLSLYSNVGSSFRVPSLKSVGGTIAAADTGSAEASGHLPSPDLKPESGLSLDVGGSYRLEEGLQLGVRAFLIAIDDQISQVEVPASGSLSQDINAGKTTTQGLELEATYRVSEMVTCFGNFTYNSTDIENPEEPDKDGAKMNFVPERVVNAGVHLTLPRDVKATVTLQLFSGINTDISNVDPGELDGYELVNARVEKLFRTKDGYDLSLYVESYNITNNKFEMPWGFQDPGFSATGGLTVSF